VLTLFLAVLLAGGVEVERVLALVGGTPILTSDTELADAAQLVPRVAGEDDAVHRTAVIDALIALELRWQDLETAAMASRTQVDLDAAWASTVKRAGGEDALRARLAAINLRLQSRDAKGALAAAQSAATALPENAQVIEALGRAQLAAGEMQQAVSTYNKLVTMMPESPAPLVLLGRAQAAAKDYDGAAQTLRKALAMQPLQMNALQQLMAVQIAAGKPDEALAEARALQKERPKDAAGWVLEGEVHLAQKKMSEAIAAYNEALKRQPVSPVAIRLHSLLGAASRAGEADALAARWLKEHPKDAAMRLHLAERDLARKDYRAASRAYRDLLVLQPENPLVLNNLAWSLAQQGDPSALGYAEKAYALAPGNPAIADTLGWMLVERGDAKRGLEILAKASAAAPNALEIRMHYAKALLKTGDKTASRKELEAVAGASGESPFKAEAADLLKKL